MARKRESRHEHQGRGSEIETAHSQSIIDGESVRLVCDQAAGRKEYRRRSAELELSSSVSTAPANRMTFGRCSELLYVPFFTKNDHKVTVWVGTIRLFWQHVLDGLHVYVAICIELGTTVACPTITSTARLLHTSVSSLHDCRRNEQTCLRALQLTLRLAARCGELEPHAT